MNKENMVSLVFDEEVEQLHESGDGLRANLVLLLAPLEVGEGLHVLDGEADVGVDQILGHGHPGSGEHGLVDLKQVRGVSSGR